MDDEKIIRNLSRELLGALGHDVEVAQHGQEALEKYRHAIATGSPFDLVILDLTIRGGMGGAETIRKLREIDPAVKAIVSSGYSDDTTLANNLKFGFKAYLKKPYNYDALRDIVNSVLS
jgi:two-component system cell cycle sensor histidine kinase/response regulator CckA